MIIQKQMYTNKLGCKVVAVLEVKINKHFEFAFIRKIYSSGKLTKREFLFTLKYNQVINIANYARVQAAMRFNNLIGKFRGE